MSVTSKSPRSPKSALVEAQPTSTPILGAEPGPWVSVRAPATIANVGPGFDVLGLALHGSMGLGDRVSLRVLPAGWPGPRFSVTVRGDGRRLPREPDLNVASVAAKAVFAIAGSDAGFELRLTKGLPLGSGLGSSAASAAAAALAANEALGHPLTLKELIPAGRAGEAIAAGSPHPDNVVPALLGGAQLVVDTDASHPSRADGSLEIVSLPVPPALRVVVVIPELEVRTADARRAIPAKIPHADAVFSASRLALLVSAFYDRDLARLRLAVADRLHEPYRGPLIRGYEPARAAALAAGALAVGISGSGPAMFAFVENELVGNLVARAFEAGFRAAGVKARAVVGRVAAARRGA